MIGAAEWAILWPAFVAGLLVTATHVPLGMQVLDRGIVFIDLAIAQVAGLGVIVADYLGWPPSGIAVQVAALSAALACAMLLTWTERRWPQVQEAIIGKIKPGIRFPPGGPTTIAEVLGVAGVAPAFVRVRAGDRTVAVPMPGQRELGATLRVSCHVTTRADGSQRCVVPGDQQPSVVAPDSSLMLAGPDGWLTFQISDVHAPSPASVAAQSQ